MFELKSLLNAVKNTDWKKFFFKNFFTVFIILIIAFGIAANVIISNNKLMIKNEVVKNAVTHLINYVNIVENAVNTVDNYYNDMLTNNYVMSYFSLEDISDARVQEYMIDMIKELKSFKTSEDVIDSIYLYNTNCDYILSVNGQSGYRDIFSDSNCFDEFEKNGRNIFYRKGKKGTNSREYISIIKAVQYGGGRGLIEFNLNCRAFENRIGFYWVNSNNEIVFCDSRELIGSNISDTVEGYEERTDKVGEIYYRDSVVITDKDIKNTDMRITAVVRPEHYNKNMGNTGAIFVLVIVLFFIISAMLAFFVVMQFYNSVMNIAIGVDSGEKTNGNELVHIKKNILKELHRNAKLEKELQNKILLVNRAKSEALQAQINPHMLYNALNLITVMELKREKKNTEVVRAISVLSDILRYAMDNSRMSVTLEEEILNVKAYSYLLEEKYRNRFSIVYDIAEETKQLLVLKMTVQPIVENAVEHGIVPCPYDGKVRVSSFIEKDMLVVRVADNGCGIGEEQIKKINDGQYDSMLDRTHTHGLINANERIRLIYGREYGCRIKSDGNGTVIDICYPLLK